jgi:N-methylhydantoinase A
MIRAVVKARARSFETRISASDGATSLDDALVHESRFYHEGAWHDAPIYDREPAQRRHEVPGPCIVSEMDSTTVVLPGYTRHRRCRRQPADQPQLIN